MCLLLIIFRSPEAPYFTYSNWISNENNVCILFKLFAHYCILHNIYRASANKIDPKLRAHSNRNQLRNQSSKCISKIIITPLRHTYEQIGVLYPEIVPHIVKCYTFEIASMHKNILYIFVLDVCGLIKTSNNLCFNVHSKEYLRTFV